MLHLQLSVHSVQMGLVRTESQSPKRSAMSNLGEIPRYFRLQQLFPIRSSSSLHGPDLSAYVLNSQVTSGFPVIQEELVVRSSIARHRATIAFSRCGRSSWRISEAEVRSATSLFPRPTSRKRSPSARPFLAGAYRRMFRGRSTGSSG